MSEIEFTPKDLKRSVVDWLLERHPAAVADYQRSYAWSESHVTAFTETLLDELSGEGTGAPDIGVAVVETTKYDEPEREVNTVVDGQQRLLSFALLLIEWCGDVVLRAEGDERNRSTRLRQLLHPHNLQSVIHARRTVRKIRNLLSRRPALTMLPAQERLTLLSSVTFSVVEFERKAGDSPNAAVSNFFEPLNTTAKPLNGGQILKAHHMGRILKDEPRQTWACQSRYEQWFRRCAGEDFELRPFEPVCFNTGERLSI